MFWSVCRALQSVPHTGAVLLSNSPFFRIPKQLGKCPLRPKSLCPTARYCEIKRPLIWKYILSLQLLFQWLPWCRVDRVLPSTRLHSGVITDQVPWPEPGYRYRNVAKPQNQLVHFSRVAELHYKHCWTNECLNNQLLFLAVPSQTEPAVTVTSR